MKKVAIVAASGVLLGTFAAHAAPRVAAPGTTAPAPTPAPRAITAAVSGPKVEFVSRQSSCGQPEKARVKITNPTKDAIQGTASLVDSSGATSTRPYAVAAGATTTLDIDGSVLDCSKALKLQEVRIFRTDRTLLDGRRAKPTKISMAGSFPPPAAGGVWIRQLHFQGACGSAGVAHATLRNQSNAQTKAKFSLAMGSANQQFNLNLMPGMQEDVTLQVPAVDCSRAIPSLAYQLVSEGGTKGNLEVQHVTFEPFEKL